MMHLTFVEIGKDRVMKLSAALSYYTVFSLPSLLIVIIGLSSRFFGKEAIEGKIYGQISGFVGTQAAMEIEGMLKNTTVNHDNLFITIVGIATLLFSATGIFGEIQDSINQIWGIEIKPGKGFVKLFLNRMLSFSMILILGFMGAVALLLSSVFNKLFSNLQAKYGEGWVNVLGVLDFLLIFSIISILFTCIFKVLPDARIKLKDALVGAMFTAMLFMLGKVLISYYLVNFAKISAFGAASSLIILLLWVYYSSIILYTGAEFTHAYSVTMGRRIEPNNYAVLNSREAYERRKALEELKKEEEDLKNDDESGTKIGLE